MPGPLLSEQRRSTARGGVGGQRARGVGIAASLLALIALPGTPSARSQTSDSAPDLATTTRWLNDAYSSDGAHDVSWTRTQFGLVARPVAWDHGAPTGRWTARTAFVGCSTELSLRAVFVTGRDHHPQRGRHGAWDEFEQVHRVTRWRFEGGHVTEVTTGSDWITLRANAGTPFARRTVDRASTFRCWYEWGRPHRCSAEDVTAAVSTMERYVEESSTPAGEWRANQVAEVRWPTPRSITPARIANALTRWRELCGGRSDPF